MRHGVTPRGYRLRLHGGSIRRCGRADLQGHDALEVVVHVHAIHHGQSVGRRGDDHVTPIAPPIDADRAVGIRGSRNHGVLAGAHGPRVLAHGANACALALEQPTLTWLRQCDRGATIVREQLPATRGGKPHLRLVFRQRDTHRAHRGPTLHRGWARRCRGTSTGGASACRRGARHRNHTEQRDGTQLRRAMTPYRARDADQRATASASSNRSSVNPISASPCAADMKPASNADGARYTPRFSAA